MFHSASCFGINCDFRVAVNNPRVHKYRAIFRARRADKGQKLIARIDSSPEEENAY